MANYIPLEEPAGRPNFHAFGDGVLYELKVDNTGDGAEDISYQFRFRTETRNPDTFLYNTGPINTLSDPDWNRPQYYSVTRVDRQGQGNDAREQPPDPPVNIGPRSTPRLRLADGRRRSATCLEAARCTPARPTIRSSSISARCSISPACGRSTRCTRSRSLPTRRR